MATVIEGPISPMSPISAHHYSSMYQHPSKGMSHVEISHLSGATMADLIVEPSINFISASASVDQISARSSRSSLANSKRHSMASTTKSSLRHSNHLLIEMLQNITSELAAHRSIMLDIQSRVSHLEHESVNNDPPMSAAAALRALEGQRSKRNSRLVPPEGQAWWEACQNFARNSEEPLSAKEFLRTPKRFSGFDWKYGPAPSRNSDTPPATPPEVDDLPPLTPTSEEEGDDTDIDMNVDEIMSSTPKRPDIDVDIEGEIKEHTVEVSKKQMPAAPILLPPPAGKPVLVNQEFITAIQPVENPHRYYKGVKSLTTYKAQMKNTKSDKEHYVLIHFHKRADLKHLEDES